MFCTPFRLEICYIWILCKITLPSSIRKKKYISLCNTSYKIITKIISNRLHPIMDKIIEPCQTSFLKNKQASDNAIIIQKIIRNFTKMKGKKGNAIMKIDLEKTFDKLECSFIRNTFHYFNFPLNIINLVMSCICTSSFAILVNGTRTNFFSPSRGIRQGILWRRTYLFSVWKFRPIISTMTSITTCGTQ